MPFSRSLGPRSLRTEALIAVVISLLILLSALVGIGQLQRESATAFRQSQSSDARLFTSQVLLLRLVDAETGVRGYAATHDRRFLEPYANSVRTIPALVATMRDTDPSIPETIRTQSQAIATTADAQLRALMRVEGRDELAPAVTSALLESGKASMDGIRAAIAHLQFTERTINAERHVRSIRDERDVTYAYLAAILIAIVASAAALLFFTNRVIGRLALVVLKTEQVAANEELSAPLRGQDEIVAVDHAVHRMAVTLRARSDELVRSNAVLGESNTQLSAVNAELERFTYSVSHDLRAPIRAIDSFSGRLEQAIAARLDAEERRLLGVIRSEAARMGCLIDDLLEFSRLGRQQMKRAQIDMTALAREVSDLAKSTGNNDFTLVLQTLPDARADRTLLKHVWDNLISNAIKYSSTRSKAVVTIDGATDGDEVVYHVSDNGVGFNMKYAHKLFEVFERLHSAEEFPGTGVGLAIVKRIVERHGGRVWATAEPGAGATISFSLPSQEVKT